MKDFSQKQFVNYILKGKLEVPDRTRNDLKSFSGGLSSILNYLLFNFLARLQTKQTEEFCYFELETSVECFKTVSSNASTLNQLLHIIRFFK